jgi:hypothetical protein
MKWFAYVSDKIEQIYPGDGPNGDIPRNVVGFENMQSVEIPETLNRMFVMWDGTQIIEDSVKKQKYFDDAWMFLRIERNNRLQMCDWTQSRDSPLTPEQQDAWSVYRKTLRDLPNAITDPTQVEWPAPPL